jgi:hypothetical protein
LRVSADIIMVSRHSSEDLMSSKKQHVTITLDPQDLERVKRVAERGTAKRH